MLQAIRSRASSWVVKALFALLILSFAVWGVGDMLGGGAARGPVAEVGGREIPQAALDQRFRGLVNQYRQFLGPDFDVEQARQFGLLDQALEALVDDALLSAAAERTGLRVGDDLVQRAILEIPAFRGLGGRFDPEQFRAVLAQNGLTEAALVADLRGGIAQQQVTGAVAAGVPAPAPLVDGLFRYQGELRVLEAVIVPAARFGDPEPPDEATLAQVHERNAPRFTRPELRDVTVLVADVDDLLAEVAATDAEIEDAYAARRGEFGAPERRSIDLVLADDEASARALAEAARASGDLAAAAAEAGRETISVEDAGPGDLFLPQLGEAAFALPQGGVSDPVETGLGWYVAQARSVTPSTVRPLEEVREEVALGVRREKAADRLFEFANQLEDALAGGATLEETAGRFGVDLVEIDGISAAGAVEGGPAPQVPGLGDVLRTAFGQPAGETSRMLEARGGTYYAVRVDSVQPAALRPLSEVRDEVLGFWRQEERRRLAVALAEEIAAEVRAGAPLAQAAEARGLEATTTDPIARDARGAPVAPEIVREGFAAPAGGVAVATPAAGAAVLRVAEVRPADPAAAEAAVREGIASSVRQGVAQDLLQQFTTALRAEIPVEIDRAAVDALYPN
jgi:peptidyl-prolyl cis-trans isomerase D